MNPIDVPGVGVVEFPDNMSDAQISAAIKSNYPEIHKPVDFSTIEMLKNVPSSAGNYLSDIAQAVMHPIDTAQNLGNLALGGAEKLARNINEYIPGDAVKNIGGLARTLSNQGLLTVPPIKDKSELTYNNEKYADQVGGLLADRYGSMDKFKSTAMQDPVGLLGDASMILTGGGSAAAKMPGMIGKAGKTAQRAGMAMEPINMARGAAKTAIAKGVSPNLPRGLYESSAKFSTTLPKAKRLALAETALKHKILPTSKGVDMVNDLITGLDTKVNSLISEATATGKTIPKSAIYRHLKEVRKNLGGAKINASDDLTQVNNAVKKLDTHLRKIKKSSFTPDELQAFKTDTYKAINFDAKQLQAKQGTTEARKAMARAAKESIEEVADVKGLNKEMGELLELRDPISRSAGRIENRNIIGIDTPIKIVAGAGAGGAPGAAGGAFMSMIEHPKVKARLAIKLKELQDAGFGNLVDQNLIPTLIQQGLWQTGRLPPADDE